MIGPRHADRLNVVFLLSVLQYWWGGIELLQRHAHACRIVVGHQCCSFTGLSCLSLLVDKYGALFEDERWSIRGKAWSSATLPHAQQELNGDCVPEHWHGSHRLSNIMTYELLDKARETLLLMPSCIADVRNYWRDLLPLSLCLNYVLLGWKLTDWLNDRPTDQRTT